VSAVARLYALLAAERGLLAEALVSAPPPDAGEAVFGPLAASGERSKANRDDYALLVESVLEGYLLHYASGRIVVPEDRDLRLLAGDQLYALGLVRLAGIGDLDAVEELADLISLCAHVHAVPSRDGEKPWALTGTLWALASLALAGGGWAEQRDAKERIRARDPDAAGHALGVARDGARRLGLGTELEQALIAFDEAVSASGSTT
jgi:hypothetical protein